uniref:Complement factor properdin n=1 Tax=Mola mola TaxID=94237 RepID=A0A3Q3X1N4_MOLML
MIENPKLIFFGDVTGAVYGKQALNHCVRCFARFDQVLGECNDELGDVDEDDCCQNPRYGYQDNNDTCKYCGPLVLSPWSRWSDCNVLCGDGVTLRHRKYFGIGNSEHRNPEANLEIRPCTGTCCNGTPKGWSQWLAWSTCSVSCGGGGVRKRRRVCSDPPECHAACSGDSDETENTCPGNTHTHSHMHAWGECSSSCIPQGKPPTRTRHRSCSNPAPSSSPPGRGCQGDKRQIENCNHLPYCPVNGDWGSWSPFSSCPVTCGVGLQVSTRKCDSPAPNHGGQPCQGATRQTNVCKTKVHCPVDGMWSEWSSWTPCKFPFGGRVIHCKHLGGSQTRERQCIHRAHNGSICSGDSLTQRRVCYDVNLCYLKGTWEGWEPWSLCNPSCGETSSRSRRRYCKPDYSEYK